MKLFFSSGTAAFKAGLILLNIKDNDGILIPQLVCDVLIQPLKELNVKPIFFKSKKNLMPDWGDINNRFTDNVKAIVMINYFGFPLDLKNFIKFKKKKQIFLIEDNCHGFGSFLKKKKLGTFGDIGFDSPGKIINNLYSGGTLYINNKDLKKNKLPQLKIYKPNILVRFKFYLKKKIFFYNLFKIFLNINILTKYKNLNKRPFYLIDKFSKKLIINFDFLQERKERILNYVFLQNFLLTKFGIFPYRKINFDTKIMPWYYVGIIKNSKQKEKVLSWSKKNKITISSWPTLPDNLKDNIFLNKLKNILVLVNLKNKNYENIKYK
jgi:hypothetical protein